MLAVVCRSHCLLDCRWLYMLAVILMLDMAFVILVLIF